MNIYLDSLWATLKLIIHSDDLNIFISDFRYDFIPNIQIFSTKRENQSINLILEVFDWKKPNFIIKWNRCKLYVDFLSEYSEKDIIVVAWYCLEMIRQKKWLYSFHWSVAFNSSIWKAVCLFWWISWIGKSTLANFIPNKNKDWEFRGDEKYIIEPNDQIVYKSNINFTKLTNKKLWRIEYIQNTKIWLFIVPIIISKTWSFELFEFDFLKKKRHFYEEMTRDIRLLNWLIGWFNFTLPSLDSKKTSNYRIKSASNLAKSMQCFFVKWTTEEIYNTISSLITSSK